MNILKAAALSACLLAPSYAAADSRCTTINEAERIAHEAAGQDRIYLATLEGKVVVFMVNDSNGSWSFWGAKDKDTLCLLSEGEKWMELGQ